MVQAVQTTYATNQQPALPGMVADLGTIRVDTFCNSGSVNIDFGLAVVRGAGDNLAVLPSAPGQEFLGATVRELSRENIDLDSTAYLPTEAMNILRREGRIYVIAENNVSAGDPVYFRTIAPTTEQVGSFRSDDAGGDADLATNCVWDTSASAGNLAIILFY